MPSIDLNCDLGESFGAYTIGMDAEILPYVTSANIACGFHAGDPSVMQKSVLLCKKYSVQVGAHPGLPDLQAIPPAEAEADVMYQIGALKAFCDAAGVPLHHVKPHGALYNMAARDPVLAAAICRAVQAAAPGAVLLALSGSEMVKAANAIGLPVASEVFADRGYQADGSLEEGKAALSGRICPAPLPGRRNFLSIKIPLYRVIQRLNNLNAALMCLGSGSCTEDEPTP